MLLLDVGNTRCKWAFAAGGKFMHHGVVSSAGLSALQEGFAALPTPQRILVSNVGGADKARQLDALCKPWGVPVEYLTPGAEQCGVRNNYQVPSQLGSDRWAALIAARQLVGDTCLVVNCGTATTVDVLSSDGVFLGGIILPGVTMMEESLRQNTAQLSSPSGALQPFPQNTADAIRSGVLRATIGAIEQQAMLAKPAGAVVCVLSGGAVAQVRPYLTMQVQYVEDLVLQGLLRIGEVDR